MDVTTTYAQLVAQLKGEIQLARIKASISVNAQLLALYWKIGHAILKNQQAEGWGTKIIDRLAKDLLSEFPDMKGISPRNLKYMRAFADAYPQFVQHAAAQTSSKETMQGQHERLQTEIMQAPLAQITWYHHITLLDKIKGPVERLFYIEQVAAHGWSRNVMVHQIESGLFKRKGAAVTNFRATLPKLQSDLATELLKDPYAFDFLHLDQEHQEKDLETALVDHMTKFLLEMGAGFSFAGRQYHLEVGGDDFYIDLLFYHFKLHCFVVIELKTGKFIPEYAGKLNFYLNVVDDTIKHEADAPSIGIIICKERNKIVAEYALRGTTAPIGVSEYQLTGKLPAALKGKLPTVKQIEAELKDLDPAKQT